MSQDRICKDYNSQNLLFKMWKYGLILPKFDYNISNGVFEFKRSYIRFLIWMILVSLNYFVIEFNYAIQSSNVIIFVVTIWNLLLFINTWSTIFLIYSAVTIIEKMSESIRNINQLKKTAGIFGYIKRKRIEDPWLIYVGILYILMVLCSIYVSSIHRDFKFAITLIVLVFDLLDIESQQLLICFKCSIVYHLQQLNKFLKNGSSNSSCLKDYKLLIDKLKETVCDFMSISSNVILVKCSFVTYSITVNIFMHIEFSKLDTLTFAFSLAANFIWICLELSMILMVVHQDHSIYRQV